MKSYKLNSKDKKLIETATQVIKQNYKRNHHINSSVGCALEASSGKIYKGINIKNLVSSPVSLDAEEGAIDQMLAQGDREVKTIVSIHKRGAIYEVFSPCGHCRQLLIQFGNPYVIISKTKKVKLKDLYPSPFLKWTR